MKPPLFGGLHARVPPEDSDDSCVSDSGDSEAEDVLKPVDEDSSSQSDGDEDQDASGRGNSDASAGRRRDVVWTSVKQRLNSVKPVPVWRAALPDADAVRLPIHYFRQFFDNELLDVIVTQSNLYCSQQNPDQALRLDQRELEQFMGTVVYMSVFRLPRSRLFWSSACRVQQVADVMPRDRWEKIKHFMHFNDNRLPSNGDRLFKIRPLIESLLVKFQALPQEQMLSVHEQVVPFKGRSVPRRGCGWGYKIFVLCDSSGLVHSFEVFTGSSDPAPGARDVGTSGNVVLKLAQVVDGSANHLLFFGSCFSSVDLLAALASRGIPALGAVQESRLQGCSFSTDAEMKKKGRGTFEEQRAVVDGVEIRAVKWFDSKALVVASTFASAQPVYNTVRWDARLKQKVCVACPSIVSFYHQLVGGADSPIDRYRIHVRSRKYYHRFFFHFVDMVIVNSWLLYCRDCDSMAVPRKKQEDLLSFRSSIAQSLCMQGKVLPSGRRDRPSSVDGEFQTKKRRRPAKAIPTQEVRSDAVGHWPVVDASRQRCKFPKCSGFTRMKCAKCGVQLCLNKNNNCFLAFHQ